MEKTRRVALALFALAIGSGGSAWAGEPVAGMQAGAARAARTAPTIRGGLDGRTAWMGAEFRQLEVRKRTDRSAGTIEMDFRFAGDRVHVAVAPDRIAVTRGKSTVVVDSGGALDRLQDVLGGSRAVFAARAMLSELEATSDLKAPEMSLLASASFLAALAGDTQAPRRLADRFVEKHRGILRQAQDTSTCWSKYSTEVTLAWNDLQDCMHGSADDGWFMGAYERIVCNAIWMLRTESAWFEYLHCLSPVGSVS